MDEKLIEHTTSKWGNKTLLSMFGVLIIGTNAFNAYIHQQENNTMQIQYEKERSDKKDERVEEKAKQMILENNYVLEIARLNRELKECKE